MNFSQAESRVVPPVVPPVDPPATPPVETGQATHRARAAVLTPHEGRAPTANLSPTKRAALLSPASQSGERPIFGVTVADLARDGMVTVTVAGQTSTATASDEYTFFAPPTVTSVSPSSGSTAGGTSPTPTGGSIARTG